MSSHCKKTLLLIHKQILLEQLMYEHFVSGTKYSTMPEISLCGYRWSVIGNSEGVGSLKAMREKLIFPEA